MRKICVIAVCAFFCLGTMVTQAKAVKPTVRHGSYGQRVMEIQAMLTELHLYRGAIDGSFGSGTELAVRAFQKKLRKPVNGMVDDLLYRIMGNRSRLYFERVKHVIDIEATAYTPYDAGCGFYTYTGIRMRKGVMAVDPKVIPLGTKGYVLGYGPVLAADTGSAIKGKMIDLAFASRAEAVKFGRRRVKLYFM